MGGWNEGERKTVRMSRCEEEGTAILLGSSPCRDSGIGGGEDVPRIWSRGGTQSPPLTFTADSSHVASPLGLPHGNSSCVGLREAVSRKVRELRFRDGHWASERVTVLARTQGSSEPRPRRPAGGASFGWGERFAPGYGSEPPRSLPARGGSVADRVRARRAPLRGRWTPVSGAGV